GRTKPVAGAGRGPTGESRVAGHADSRSSRRRALCRPARSAWRSVASLWECRNSWLINALGDSSKQLSSQRAASHRRRLVPAQRKMGGGGDVGAAPPPCSRSQRPNLGAMDIAPPGPDPGHTAVKFDQERIQHAVFGAAILVLGIWLVWLGGWMLGWPMGDLGVEPRRLGGLVGVLSAPLVHASFSHLMSNTLPLALLACLMLYAYPRAARTALPMIWLLAGLGVWLFARSSVHVGMSGINHGLMFFLFLTGMLRRDRLGVAISLVVFFFYG